MTAMTTLTLHHAIKWSDFHFLKLEVISMICIVEGDNCCQN